MRPAAPEVALTPAQNKVATDLIAGIASGHVSVLRAGPGMGKTTVLRSPQELRVCHRQ